MTRQHDEVSSSVAWRFPAKHLPRPEVRPLPEAPTSTRRIIGPGIIAAGVGLASGEFILFPYIASQVGLVFVWAAVVGLVTQFFLNMEIERYTLATGETALTGFSRFWRHWGLVFAVLTIFANLWPGWATSSATMITYLVGGDVRWITMGLLLAIGLILTLAPVVYVALEKAEMLKVAAVLVLLAVGAIVAISADAWADAPKIITDASVPVEPGSRCCSAHSRSPARAVARTWCRATGSATRASAWAGTCRGSRARSPANRRPRRAPASSSSRPTNTCRAGVPGGGSPTGSSSTRSC
jgi:hypothetical protein